MSVLLGTLAALKSHGRRLEGLTCSYWCQPAHKCWLPMAPRLQVLVATAAALLPWQVALREHDVAERQAAAMGRVAGEPHRQCLPFIASDGTLAECRHLAHTRSVMQLTYGVPLFLHIPWGYHFAAITA